jgi:hypothetical protein
MSASDPQIQRFHHADVECTQLHSMTDDDVLDYRFLIIRFQVPRIWRINRKFLSLPVNEMPSAFLTECSSLKVRIIFSALRVKPRNCPLLWTPKFHYRVHKNPPPVLSVEPSHPVASSFCTTDTATWDLSETQNKSHHLFYNLPASLGL